MTERIELWKLLVNRYICHSEADARQLIMDGRVKVDDVVMSGLSVNSLIHVKPEAAIEILPKTLKKDNTSVNEDIKAAREKMAAVASQVDPRRAMVELLHSTADAIDQGYPMDKVSVVILLRQAATLLENGKQPEPFGQQSLPLSVPERLRQSAALFESRNAEYGDSYRNFGRVLFNLLGEQMITNVDQWGRIGVFVLMAGKMDRYARNFARGGHADSLRDLSVYAAMQADLDEAKK